MIYITLYLLIFSIIYRITEASNAEIYLPGIKDSFRINFDSNGIPYINATSWEDAMFAQGYLHGIERTFTLEMMRLTVTGQLASVIGEAGLESDKLMKSLDLCRDADETASDTFIHYSSGIEKALNSYITEEEEIEGSYMNVGQDDFKALNYVPTNRWTPKDTMCLTRFIALQMNAGLTIEYYHRLVDQALQGDEQKDYKVRQMNQNVFPMSPSDSQIFNNQDGTEAHPSTPLKCKPMLEEPLKELKKFKKKAEVAERILSKIDERVKAVVSFSGSNSWAISGSRTISGKPLLAVDPHLPYSTPSFWYPMLIIVHDGVQEQVRVVGGSTPGFPGIHEGHNAYAAWGITLSLLDSQDLFEIEFPEDDDSFDYFELADGTRSPVSKKHHTIEVRVPGGTSTKKVDFTSMESVHGPIIHVDNFKDIMSSEKTRFALASTVLQSPFPSEYAKNLAFAENWSDLYEAVLSNTLHGFSMTWATRENDIGIFHTGAVPCRALPVDHIRNGQDPRYDWKGLEKPDVLPHIMNPLNTPYVMSANHPISPNTHEQFGNSFTQGGRAERLAALLEDMTRQKATSKYPPKLSMESLKMIQLDVQNVRATRWLEQMVLMAEKMLWIEKGDFNTDPVLCPSNKFYLEYKEWSRYSLTKSKAAAVYKFWPQFALQRFVKTESWPLLEVMTGKILNDYVGATEGGVRDFWRFVLERRLSNDPELAKTYQEILCASLDDTLDYIMLYSKENKDVTLETFNTYTLKHPLENLMANTPKEFSVGPVASDGDSETVNVLQRSYPLIPIGEKKTLDPSEIAVSGPGIRMLMDLDDWSKSQWNFTPGVSGMKNSSYYSNTHDSFKKGTYFPILWTDDEISKNTVDTVKFIPSKEEGVIKIRTKTMFSSYLCSINDRRTKLSKMKTLFY